MTCVSLPASWQHSHVIHVLYPTHKKQNVLCAQYPCAENKIISKEVWFNLLRLTDISRLSNNWNGYGAPALSEGVISRTRSLIIHIPQTFFMSPTARNSIQIEYENAVGDYLELELFENQIVVYCEKGDKDYLVSFSYSQDDLLQLTKEVGEFCESDI